MDHPKVGRNYFSVDSGVTIFHTICHTLSKGMGRPLWSLNWSRHLARYLWFSVVKKCQEDPAPRDNPEQPKEETFLTCPHPPRGLGQVISLSGALI